MNFTLTLGETCELLLAIALFILLLYCISLIRNLIPSVKSLTKVMKDVEIITESAAKSTQSAEAVVSDVVDITSNLVATVKTPAGFVGHISSIALAVKSIVELVTSRESRDGDVPEDEPQTTAEETGTDKADKKDISD